MFCISQIHNVLLSSKPIHSKKILKTNENEESHQKSSASSSLVSFEDFPSSSSSCSKVDMSKVEDDNIEYKRKMRVVLDSFRRF